MTGLARELRAAARTAAFTAAGVSVVGGLIAQGGRFNPGFDVASNFAPFWLAAALFAGAWALAAEQAAPRRALLGMAILGVLASGALMAPELTRPLPSPATAEPSFRLRLIQFNTWDALADRTRVADWIASENPDVVTIEEVTEPLRQALIRRGFQYTRGMAGVAIFSRQRRTYTPFFIPGPVWATLPGFARATFPGPDGGRPFSVVAAHLTWPTVAETWRQRSTFATLLDHYPRDRLIVAGDFNLTPWSFALRGLDRRFGLERRDRAIPTWPALQALGVALIAVPAVLPIDHVYAGSAWRTVSIRRGPRIGSDHYPLIVDLALAAPASVHPAGAPAGWTGSRVSGFREAGQ
jgi:endonuclease/exonuclease/phosphatase (EEP) superfamily protein YafD